MDASRKQIVVGKEDEPPPRKQILLRPGLENSEVAILNPAVAQEDLAGKLHIYPRVDLGRGRTVRTSRIDHIEAYFDSDQVILDHSSRGPLLVPEDPDESYEDPRATVIDGICYLTFTKFNRRMKTVDAGLAVSEDFVNFHGLETISPRLTVPRALEIIGSRKHCSEYSSAWFETYKAKKFCGKATLDFKNFALFPEKIDGQFALVIRVLPNMLILRVNNLEELKKQEFWEQEVFEHLDKYVLMKPARGNSGWQGNRIGIGPPPIKAKDDWLLVYHGAKLNPRAYCMGAAVLDKSLKVTGRTHNPIIFPEEAWERNGLKHDVIYLTGTAFNEGIYFFGGAADTVSFQVGPYKLENLIEKCDPI